MKILVSGIEREFAEQLNVASLLERDSIEASGIAVAVNDFVVRKALWHERALQDGDKVEIVRAVQGG